MVSQRVEAAWATTGARRQGERQAQPSQKEHPEVVGGQGDSGRRWSSVSAQPLAAQTGQRMSSGVSDWARCCARHARCKRWRAHVGWRTADASPVAVRSIGSRQMAHRSAAGRAGGGLRERSDSRGVLGGVSSSTVTTEAAPPALPRPAAAEGGALPPGTAWTGGLRREVGEASRERLDIRMCNCRSALDPAQAHETFC